MTKSKLRFGLFAVFILFVVLLAAIPVRTAALAGDSRLQLTYDDGAIGYVKEGTEVTRTVYVNGDLYPDLSYITYDVVTSTSSEIMYRTIRKSEGGATGENLTTEKNDVLVRKSDLTPTDLGGKKAYSFKVGFDRCCAFIFTVYYDTGEDEDVPSYDSEVLYLDNVDSQPPTFTIETNRFLMSVTCKFSDDSSVCAKSGVKSYTVYKKDMDTGVKTEYLTSSDINRNTATFTIPSGSGHYNYYVTATDYVGNTSAEKLVATYDVDALIRTADNAFNTIESSSEYWSEAFKTKLNNAYNEYTLKRNGTNGEVSDEEKQEAAEKLSDVLSEYNGYKSDMLNGRRNVEFKTDNAETLSSGLNVDNLYKACAFIKFGEKGTLLVGVYKSDYSDVRKAELEQSGLEKATSVYAFSVRVFATEQGDCDRAFSVPLELSFSVDPYKQIAAVQVVTEESGVTTVPCRIKEYTNGNLVMSVPNTTGLVYLFVEEEQPKKDNKWLYLLFLLIIPVASGTACLILYQKRKKSLRSNNNGRKETDNQ